MTEVAIFHIFLRKNKEAEKIEKIVSSILKKVKKNLRTNKLSLEIKLLYKKISKNIVRILFVIFL